MFCNTFIAICNIGLTCPSLSVLKFVTSMCNQLNKDFKYCMLLCGDQDKGNQIVIKDLLG